MIFHGSNGKEHQDKTCVPILKVTIMKVNPSRTSPVTPNCAIRQAASEADEGTLVFIIITYSLYFMSLGLCAIQNHQSMFKSNVRNEVQLYLFS